MASPPLALRPYGARACVLLVLAVLTGLVAMHGLGPVPVAQHERAAQAVSGHTAGKAHHGPRTAHSAETACHHLAYGHGGGHTDHADATCAASGVSGGPSLAAPLPNGSAGAETSEHQAVREAASAVERAPPSLSQLQLLRI